MKTVTILLLFIVALFMLWRLNSARKPPLLFDGKKLHIHHAGCSIDLPSTGSESDSVDVIDIERRFLRLPDGSQILYEWADFPLTYDFAYPADAIVAKIFGFDSFHSQRLKPTLYMVRGEDGESREFSVLVVVGGRHRLELLYPLDAQMAERVEECLVDGRTGEFSAGGVSIDTTIRSRWSEAGIVTENMVEKDM
ncbi:hypothetical protein [Hydrogenimonas sp.]